MVVVVLVVVLYGGGESDWGEDIRSWKKVYGEERAEFLGWWRGEPWRGNLEMVSWVGGFLTWGFGGDCCGVYGLIVLLVEVLSFFFYFSRHVKRRIDVTAEAHRKKLDVLQANSGSTLGYV